MQIQKNVILYEVSAYIDDEVAVGQVDKNLIKWTIPDKKTKLLKTRTINDKLILNNELYFEIYLNDKCLVDLKNFDGAVK